MAYRFDPSEPLSTEARRILTEQIERAEKKLRTTQDRAVAVHEARKHFKRVRALLRLLRPALDKQTFRSENAEFRDIARLLAGARDAHVLAQTIARLEELHGPVATVATAQLRSAVDGLQRPAAATAGSTPVKEALRRLKSARTRIAKIPFDACDATSLATGLERCYSEALLAREDALRSGADEAFHEWRKRVQQHWRHMGLLAKAWPDFFNARSRTAKRLSASLGDDHDLAVLISFTEGLPSETMPAAQKRELTRLARVTQTDLRRSATIDADRLFADGAKGLARRVELYWSSAVELARAGHATGRLDDGDAAGGDATPAAAAAEE